MKKTYLIIILMFFILRVYSQNVVSYAYDSSGNRISRSVSSNEKRLRKSRKGKNNTGKTKEAKAFPIMSYDHSTNIISVNLGDSDVTGTLLLNVYTLSGSLIYSKTKSSDVNTFPVSSIPSGTYIASLEIGERQYTMKFTKE